MRVGGQTIDDVIFTRCWFREGSKASVLQLS